MNLNIAGLFTGLLLLAMAPASKAGPSETIPSGCGQIVLVTTPDWNASSGTLRRFSRASAHAPWSEDGDPAPVLLGKKGLGWCAGVRAIPNDHAPRKTEGDHRSPAGIFSITDVFSRETIDGLRMRFILLTPSMEAIDDPRSRYYNRIVDRDEIPHPDWRSSEKMAAIRAYSLGIVVAANPSRTPGAGSCIFLHLWEGLRTGTSGCTALHHTDLLTLVHWLDPDQAPILIQLPKETARGLPVPP